MDGYAVTIRADITPRLTERELAAVQIEAGGTIAYDSGTSMLRFTASSPDPDASIVTMAAYGADTLTRAVRRAGATAAIREARVLAMEDFEAETFRPSTPPGGLAGTAEVAEILHVTPQRVPQLLKDRADFPRPVAELAATPVWDRAEVDAFSRTWERRPGRPRKASAGEG